MEYMNNGDLYNFVRDNKKSNLNGILGCYLNGLNILHNDLKIIHGDLTPNNILVHYIGPNYRQRIIVNDENYFINTNGYCYKICDFGLANYLENTKQTKHYINHIYRDYLLLFFIYFYKNKFDNYNNFAELIETPLGYIYDDFYNGYRETDDFKKNIIDNYTYNSICDFLNKYLQIDFNNKLIFKLPKLLLLDLVDTVFGCEI
jgi:serine/threonine protein kinase